MHWKTGSLMCNPCCSKVYMHAFSETYPSGARQAKKKCCAVLFLCGLDFMFLVFSLKCLVEVEGKQSTKSPSISVVFVGTSRRLSGEDSEGTGVSFSMPMCKDAPQEQSI